MLSPHTSSSCLGLDGRPGVLNVLLKKEGKGAPDWTPEGHVGLRAGGKGGGEGAGGHRGPQVVGEDLGRIRVVTALSVCLSNL